MAERIVAVFDTIAGADAAETELHRQGIAGAAIRRFSPHDADAPHLAHGADLQAGTTAPHPAPEGGFWSRLFGGDEYSETERTEYEGHLGAGRVLMSVDCVDNLQATEVMRVLEGHNAAEIEAQPEAGSATATMSTAPRHETVAERIEDRVAGAAPRDATVNVGSGTAGGIAGSQPSQLGSTEEVIPLSEEQIAVGKRMVDRGTTRIRRYVVSKPVEEQVTLHGERTTIERRVPVSGAAGDSTAFEERTVEVRERQEEPVVERTSRVVEEVVVKKEATETVETVREEVRREEVEVDEATRATSASRASETVYPPASAPSSAGAGSIPLPDERAQKERGAI